MEVQEEGERKRGGGRIEEEQIHFIHDYDYATRFDQSERGRASVLTNQRKERASIFTCGTPSPIPLDEFGEVKGLFGGSADEVVVEQIARRRP